MNPAQAAKMLADLNWSGMPTAHQIAVSAALETLKAIPVTACDAEMFKPGEFKTRVVVPVSAEVFAGLGGVIVTDTPSNVAVLPVKPRTCWTSLHHLDGRRWASSSHFGPGGAWNWILDTVMAEHGVAEDQIGSAESDETQPYDCDDLVTIDGLPVYRISHSAILS